MDTVRAHDEPRAGEHEAPALEPALAAVRELLGEGHVEEARALARELAMRFPDSTGAQRLARVLAPPVTRLRPDITVQSRDQEHDWLREHAAAYPGQWLAVLGHRLLVCNADFRALMAELRQTLDGDRALLHFQPARKSEGID